MSYAKYPPVLFKDGKLGELEEGSRRWKDPGTLCKYMEFQRTKLLHIKITLSKLHRLLAVCMNFSGDFFFLQVMEKPTDLK